MKSEFLEYLDHTEVNLFIFCITHLTLHGSVTLRDTFNENLLEKQKGSASFRDG